MLCDPGRKLPASSPFPLQGLAGLWRSQEPHLLDTLCAHRAGEADQRRRPHRDSLQVTTGSVWLLGGGEEVCVCVCVCGGGGDGGSRGE